MSTKTQLIVNSVSKSCDSDLLTLATNYGYSILSNINHKILKNNNTLGPMQFANNYFKSEIIILVGENSNTKYPQNVLLIYNELQKKVLCDIKLKSQIKKVDLSKNIIFIKVIDNILLFDFITLKLLKTIKDVYLTGRTDPYDILPQNILAYVPTTDTSKILLIKYILPKSENPNFEQEEELNNEYEEVQKNIQTTLELIQTVKFSKTMKYIIAVNGNGTKVHIYDLSNNNLVICLYIGNIKSWIKYIGMNNNDSFLGVVQNETNSMITYNLSNMNFDLKSKCICKCKDIDDYKDESKDKSFFSFFNNIFSKSDEGKIHDKISIMDTSTILFFDFSDKISEKIEIITSNSNYHTFKFDKDNPGKIQKYIGD